ncbi:MAG: phosphoribosylglycinamide formyltransferase [Epulopiscium sp.]|jgi:phosphoribosylglycinamide formyltransferase-1|nr:phosphoribosylglycinamide formyltransferase [Candidatus Epulonipiscium sp.]
MFKIGILVSGGGTNFQAIIDAIDAGKITDTKIVTLVSSNPNAYALERAKKHGIEGVCIRKKDFETDEEYQQALVLHMQNREVDLVVMAGFMVVIGSIFIQAFKNRIINIHPSLIPSFCGNGYYGLKVHEAALQKGVKITGATVHFVTEETDAGPIILQKAVEVKENDTPETLQLRVMEEAEWIILPQAIQLAAHGKLKVENQYVRIL